jgi:hypothetical protein
MFQELRFREYYGHLADDELARIAQTDELVPEAGDDPPLLPTHRVLG